ncbi:MAG: NAD(P)/FAD-dependent oxidoreductase [Ktedonobacteraceae bacterium]|nr:NAD(P)/FAD-dependent oxidoreductase [Ktedonobacteraceae bacterium]
MASQYAQTDVVVVGGGLAGLSTACYLARAGVSVTLFEKASNVGGRATTQHYEGYSFNRGAHALYQGGAATQVLQELNIPYSGRSPKELFALSQGTIYPYPSTAFELLRTNLLSASDKLELGNWLTAVPRLKPHTLSRMSVQEWLEHTLKRLRVRQTITATAHTATYSAALDQVSAEVFVVQMQLLLKKPVFYIDGGWQKLVDELRLAAEQAGARVVSGSRVEAVLHQDDKVLGVRLRNGEIVHTSSVVMATDPHDASMLVDDGKHPYLHMLDETISPVQVACLDVALRHLPPTTHQVVLDLDQPRFLAFQSLVAKIAPAEGGLVHTLKYLDPTHPTDPQQDERDLEDLLDATQPGWRDEEIKRVFLPRIEAAGMLVTANGGGLNGRPGPQVEGISGLYLVGDWIGSEGYLPDASLASARQVAQQLALTIAREHSYRPPATTAR